MRYLTKNEVWPGSSKMWYRKTGDNANFIGQYRIFCQKMRQFFLSDNTAIFFSRKYRNYLRKNVGGMLPLETIQQRNIAVTGERVHHGPYIRW